MVRKRDIKHFRDLEVYKRAFAAAMEIFQITKSYPMEEKYSLLDGEYEQIISMLNSMELNAQKFCF